MGGGSSQVIRNPAEALEVVVSDGKDHVAAGKIDYLTEKRDFGEVKFKHL